MAPDYGWFVLNAGYLFFLIVGCLCGFRARNKGRSLAVAFLPANIVSVIYLAASLTMHFGNPLGG